MPPKPPGGQGGPCSAFAKFDFMSQAISRTRRWKGAFLITDLTKDDGPRVPTVGFLQAPEGSG